MGTEMGKAEKSRDYRLAEVHKLSAEIGELDSKQDSLELEIKELKESLADLKSTAEEATELRESEKKENVAQIKKAREGLTAVTEAIGILKTFYKSAAKASLLQASPVDEENPGAASGSYKGNQAASGGVIGLLEVIKSDFEHTVETVGAEEKQAAADFVEFDRKNKVSTSGKSTKLELDTEDLATTISTLEETHKDLKSNMDLLDSALEELEELKPTCVDSGMSYSDRVKRREQEMAALKNAMCMLDADKVEPECQ